MCKPCIYLVFMLFVMTEMLFETVFGSPPEAENGFKQERLHQEIQAGFAEISFQMVKKKATGKTRAVCCFLDNDGSVSCAGLRRHF